MKKKKIISLIRVVLPFLVTFSVAVGVYKVSKTPAPQPISYQEFMKRVDQKEIDKVTIDLKESKLSFTDTNKSIYTTDNPKYDTFKKDLLEKGVTIDEVKPTNIVDASYRMLSLLFTLMMLFMVLKLLRNGHNKNMSTPIETSTGVTFDNIAGNNELKKDLELLVDFLKHPKKFSARGAKMPKGIILYGPPGTGKTLTAKAIAGEANVPFFYVSGSDFMEMYVGVGAKRVRELFKQARQKSPCIIFIDEIDAVGSSRNMDSNSERKQTINALLSEMDGFTSSTGILVIAATNRLDDLDEALIRAGRFDKHIMVPLPSTPKERLEIINLHTKNKKFSEEVSFENLAKQTTSFSGADIESLINEATLISVQLNKEVIDNECLDKAFYQKILGGHAKEDADRQDDEIEIVAYHEAGHALVGKLTGMSVSKVTVISSTSGAGGVTFVNPKKAGLNSLEEIHNNIKMTYGGRVAEYILLEDINKVTTGAYQDIQQATVKIRELITSYGMNEEVGMLNLKLLNVDNKYIFEEAKKLSNKLYEETVELLSKHKHILDKIAKTLIERETICEEELDTIIADCMETYQKSIQLEE